MRSNLLRLLAAAGCLLLLAARAHAQAADTAALASCKTAAFTPCKTAGAASCRTTGAATCKTFAPCKFETFKPKKLILPAALIAVGTVGVCSDGFQSLNREVRDGMGRLRGGDHYIHADDYVQYLPLAAHLGLGCLGVKSRHNFKERLAIDATAYLSMGILVNATKYSVRERRPDSGARNSFPSGHTATAFMGAELARMEYGTGIGIGAYALASGVAFLRLYNNRHWLNDVVAGAGIGILSARIGCWMLPLYRRWFGWDTPQSPAQIAFMPGYDAATHALQVGMAMRF